MRRNKFHTAEPQEGIRAKVNRAGFHECAKDVSDNRYVGRHGSGEVDGSHATGPRYRNEGWAARARSPSLFFFWSYLSKPLNQLPGDTQDTCRHRTMLSRRQSTRRSGHMQTADVHNASKAHRHLLRRKDNHMIGSETNKSNLRETHA